MSLPETGIQATEGPAVSIALIAALLAAVLARFLRQFVAVAAQLDAALDALAGAILADNAALHQEEVQAGPSPPEAPSPQVQADDPQP